ncbi:MAG TPA: TlpA disulfide reductase family protein [Xanthomonadales bacterium]|nr:TlpA disulfide reductase family protein [Xanthomonadales bacterium]
MRLIAIILLGLALAACDAPQPPAQPVENTAADANSSETWRVAIELPGIELPVKLHLANDFSEAWFSNGSERVMVPEIHAEGQKLTLRFPAFNNTFSLVHSGDSMSGTLTLVKRGYEQVMPVHAARGDEQRFVSEVAPAINVTGRWETVFTDSAGKQTQAIGEFDQQGSRVVGTFLTPTGDYRYLEGQVSGRQLLLSTFDGAHAFAFSANLNAADELEGGFWSGTRSYESWVAKRNFDARLPDAYSLTYLKEGYDRLEFSFPDLDGNPVSLGDPRFKGKVVLVTLSGSWCPNCADEVEFLSGYYRSNHQRGLEIVTLLYEHFEDFERAAQQGKRLRDEFDVGYELLIAGLSDKTLAAETLPMLNHVLAFPTTIFVDRSGAVRRIHTGFSGPGTGSYYTQFVEEFNRQMDDLLAEPPP